jgi:predicted GIY-YIG superfamily endonuclease
MKDNAQYIYIVQATLEPSKCKIGVTNNLERRLNEYNNITGKSQENFYQYLFACEVDDMLEIEKNVKEKFSILREKKNREIYFYNSGLFDEYVNFIKSHKHFIKEVIVKQDTPRQETKIVKKTTPTLKDRGITHRDVMKRAKRVQNDEFYTRYEDVEKELMMYDKSI